MLASRFALSLIVAVCGCKAFDPPSSTPAPGEMFAPCCGALGTCIAAGLIPDPLAARLAADSCGLDLLCVPSGFLTQPRFTSRPCRAPGNVEGRCLPACLPEVRENAAVLRRADCAEGELCAPCFDPIHGGDLEICHLAGDQPLEPAKTFERCCGGGGACVPAELLNPEQLAVSPADSCSDPAMRCAPLDLLTEGGALPSCREGPEDIARVCVRACFLSVRLGNFLPRDSCSEDARCVPCSNLEMTGACP